MVPYSARHLGLQIQRFTQRIFLAQVTTACTFFFFFVASVEHKTPATRPNQCKTSPKRSCYSKMGLSSFPRKLLIACIVTGVLYGTVLLEVSGPRLEYGSKVVSSRNDDKQHDDLIPSPYVVDEHMGKMWVEFPPYGWNNQRQNLMAAAWMARVAKRQLLLPTTFRQSKHDTSSPSPVASIMNLTKLRSIVAVEVKEKPPEENMDWIKATPYAIQPGANALELRHVLKGIPHCQHLVAKADYMWLDNSLVFDEDFGISRDDFWGAFQFTDKIQSCAASNVQRLTEQCSGGLHGAHLRFSDVPGHAHFDCARGQQIFGRPLVERAYCVFAESNLPVTIEDVLMYDLGPDYKWSESSCVYIATDSPEHPKTQRFKRVIGNQTPAQMYTYADLDLSNEDCQGINPSNLEQAIAIQIPGRWVSSHLSSWDEYVIVQRALQNRGVWHMEEQATFYLKAQAMLRDVITSHNFPTRPNQPFQRIKKTRNPAACQIPAEVIANTTATSPTFSLGSEDDTQTNVGNMFCKQNPYASKLTDSLETIGARMDEWLSPLNFNKVLHQARTNETWKIKWGPYQAFKEMTKCQLSERSCVGGPCKADESKITCGLSALEPGCVVYSIGGNNQWGFEMDLLKKTPCDIHTFDCTGSISRFQVPQHDRIHFHHICLGTRHEDAPETCPIAKKGMFPSKCGATLTLLEIQNLLGHKQIDLFKIDIEGYEWSMFESWPELKALDAIQDSVALPMQVLVEIHYRTMFRDLWKQNQTHFLQPFKSPVEVAELQRHLLNMGYTVIERDDNRRCDCCTELTLLRTRCLPTISANESLDDSISTTNVSPRVAGNTLGKNDQSVATNGWNKAGKKNSIIFFELGQAANRNGFGSLTFAILRFQLMYLQTRNATLILDERSFGNYRRNATHGVYKGFFETNFPVIDVNDNVTQVLEQYRNPDIIKISTKSNNGWKDFARRLHVSMDYLKGKYHNNVTVYGHIKSYACGIRHNNETEREIRSILDRASIPRFDNSSTTTAAFHIRRGDKIRSESRAFGADEYVQKLVTETSEDERAAIEHCYVATDDFSTVSELQVELEKASIPCQIHTMSSPKYDARRNTSGHAILFFVDLYMLTRATFFVGSFNSNVGGITALWRSCYHEQDQSGNEANRYHHFYRSYGVDAKEWFFGPVGNPSF